MTLQSVLKAHVLEVFYQNNGNYTHTAKALGVSIRALREWINHDLWPYDRCGEELLPKPGHAKRAERKLRMQQHLLKSQKRDRRSL